MGSGITIGPGVREPTNSEEQADRGRDELTLLHRVDQPHPVIEEEFDSCREQGDSAHHGETKSRTEGDHQIPDADSCGLPDDTLVLD